MNCYKVLDKQKFSIDNFSIVPIRFDDRMDIMKWRNEQLYHLRQQKPLTVEDQDNYFKNIVSKLFDQEQPTQILFSFLENEVCIGYGGLVHINWTDKNAEISFIMNTSFEKERFHEIWVAYLKLLEDIAFKELSLHKIYTYAFDLRPHLYEALVDAGFNQESRLKEHCLVENKFYDVVIHSKIHKKIQFRPVSIEDLNLTFDWASNKEIRKFSGNRNEIVFDEHKKWFESKINADNCYYLIATINGKAIGSIRFDIDGNNEATISYLIDTNHQGKGYGKVMLSEACQLLVADKNISKIKGIVFKDNIASYKAFTDLDFKITEEDAANFVTFEKNI